MLHSTASLYKYYTYSTFFYFSKAQQRLMHLQSYHLQPCYLQSKNSQTLVLGMAVVWSLFLDLNLAKNTLVGSKNAGNTEYQILE